MGFLLWIVFSSFIILVLLTMVISGKSFAPWLPSRSRDLSRIFKIINLKENEIFYDLGCGDGRMVFYAAKNYGAKSIGLEIGLPMFFFCRIKQWFIKDKNVVFKYRNLFKEDLSDVDAVYIYGLPDTINCKLKNKFEKELKAGARVISYAFSIKDWIPERVDKPEEKDASIYLYKIS